MFLSLWQWIKKITFFVWIVFMVVIGIWLAKENGQLVELTLLSFELPKMSLGLLVVLCLFIGVTLGFFTNYLVLKPSLIANKRALKKANTEVNTLRIGDIRSDKTKA